MRRRRPTADGDAAHRQNRRPTPLRFPASEHLWNFAVSAPIGAETPPAAVALPPFAAAGSPPLFRPRRLKASPVGTAKRKPPPSPLRRRKFIFGGGESRRRKWVGGKARQRGGEGWAAVAEQREATPPARRRRRRQKPPTNGSGVFAEYAREGFVVFCAIGAKNNKRGSEVAALLYKKKRKKNAEQVGGAKAFFFRFFLPNCIAAQGRRRRRSGDGGGFRFAVPTGLAFRRRGRKRGGLPAAAKGGSATAAGGVSAPIGAETAKFQRCSEAGKRRGVGPGRGFAEARSGFKFAVGKAAAASPPKLVRLYPPRLCLPDRQPTGLGGAGGVGFADSGGEAASAERGDEGGEGGKAKGEKRGFAPKAPPAIPPPPQTPPPPRDALRRRPKFPFGLCCHNTLFRHPRNLPLRGAQAQERKRESFFLLLPK